MSEAISPPTLENVSKLDEIAGNAIYYTDVQAAELEIHRAQVEGRDPNFDGIPAAAVTRAGGNLEATLAKTVEPLETEEVVDPRGVPGIPRPGSLDTPFDLDKIDEE